MSIDLGTGDGRLPWTWAREDAERLFVGVDANAAGLREFSGRAFRAGLTNAVYIRAALESLPPELAGVADRVTILLPWGSLLAAVALPSVVALQGIRSLCQPGARLTVVLGSDATRDSAEIERLGLPTLSPAERAPDLSAGYATAGFALAAVRPLAPDQFARWPSTWARRLAHGQARSFWQLEARASGSAVRT